MYANWRGKMVENEILVQSVTDNKEMIKASFFFRIFPKESKIYIFIVYTSVFIFVQHEKLDACKKLWST
jgi:hypothetical protein